MAPKHPQATANIKNYLFVHIRSNSKLAQLEEGEKKCTERKKENMFLQWPATLANATMFGARKPTGPKF